MKRLATTLCLIMIAVSFCACGNKSPNKLIKEKFDIKMPKGAVVEYYYREGRNIHGDNPGFHYVVYSLEAEPTELLEKYSYIDKPAGENLPYGIAIIDSFKKTIDQRVSSKTIPEKFAPDWDGHYLAIKKSIILYFPHTQKLIFYFN